jgi:hypothetical protein
MPSAANSRCSRKFDRRLIDDVTEKTKRRHSEQSEESLLPVIEEGFLASLGMTEKGTFFRSL